MEFHNEQEAKAEVIYSEDLTPPTAMIEQTMWVHAPLVLLNGCGTVGFSPDALSPFITKFVNDQGVAHQTLHH